MSTFKNGFEFAMLRSPDVINQGTSTFASFQWIQLWPDFLKAAVVVGVMLPDSV